MTTPATIMELEQSVLKMIGEIVAGKVLLKMERERNEGWCDYRVSDYWGTLNVNLERLIGQARELSLLINASRSR